MVENNTAPATPEGEKMLIRPAGTAPVSVSISVSISLSRIAFAGKTILTDFNLTLEAGSLTCLLGPSGVGKTSILKSIAGILPLEDGSEIRANDGKNVRNRIAYMDQNDLLLPWATVLDNLLIAARLRGTKPDTARARRLLAQVGLDAAANDLPHTLSGGMRQRVALARTLMEDAPVILVDEPFSALDTITRHRLQALLVHLCKGRTILMITHDPMEALRLGNHIYVLAGDPVTLTAVDPGSNPAPRALTDPDLQPRFDEVLHLLGMTDAEGTDE